MNLLLINPPGSKSKLEQFHVSDYLRREFKINSFVSYLDDNKPKINRDYFFSFDDWVKNNKDLINKKNIHDLEKEYPKSNLWKIIVSQRTYYDYSYLDGAEPHFNPKLDDSIFELKSLVLFYSKIIKKYNIDTVLAHAGDNMHSTTLFTLAKSLKIKTFQMNAILFKKRLFYLCDDEYFRSSLLRSNHHKYEKNFDDYVRPHLKQLLDLKKSLLGFNPVEEVKEIWFDISILNMIKNNIKSLNRFLSFDNIFFSGFEQISKHRTFILKFKSSIKRYFFYLITENFVKYEKKVLKSKYVYFPLHLQPEATLLSTSPVFSDQLSVIRGLSASLPAGYKLAIKDYPLQGGHRSMYFYKQIKKLPNVVLYHRLFPSLKLLESCKMVVSIQGSVGFEALLRNKKVLLLSRAFYDSIYGLKKVNNYKDLHSILKRYLIENVDKKKQDSSLMAFLKAWLDITYEENVNPVTEKNKIINQSRKTLALINKNLKF